MNKQKGYNSILFLTTLSVYFGLLLVGTPPSVFAQQVIVTDNLAVQNEKDSEDKGLEDYFLVRLDKALNTFVDDLRKLKRRGKYKINGNEEILVGCGHTFCSNNIVDATSSYVDSWVAAEIENLRKNLDIGADRDYREVPGFVEEFADSRGNLNCKDFGLEFLIDKSTFEVRISFTQESSPKAYTTATNLNTLFANKAAVSSKTSTKRFYENTKAKTDNSQVLVITRLPRGSLNALVRRK